MMTSKNDLLLSDFLKSKNRALCVNTDPVSKSHIRTLNLLISLQQIRRESISEIARLDHRAGRCES